MEKRHLFDVDTKQIVFLDTFSITNLVKWVCLQCTIALSHAHRTFESYKFILKSRLSISEFYCYH